MRYPLDGNLVITSGYQKNRLNPADLLAGHKVYSDHLRVDLHATEGTPVYAVMSGLVVWADQNGAWGNQVRLSGTVAGKRVTVYYSHLSQFQVTQGQQVSEGQEIGLSGRTGKVTGPHLDFGIMADGEMVEPLDFIKDHPTWDQAKEIKQLMESGLLENSRQPSQPVTWGELSTVLNRLKIQEIMK